MCHRRGAIVGVRGFAFRRSSSRRMPNAASSLFNATTEVRDRFWIKRYGPSRRRAQNASAALRTFVRHPKKTFATISAPLRHADGRGKCLLIGVDRKWSAHSKNDEIDPSE